MKHLFLTLIIQSSMIFHADALSPKNLSDSLWEVASFGNGAARWDLSLFGESDGSDGSNQYTLIRIRTGEPPIVEQGAWRLAKERNQPVLVLSELVYKTERRLRLNVSQNRVLDMRFKTGKEEILLERSSESPIHIQNLKLLSGTRWEVTKPAPFSRKNKTETFTLEFYEERGQMKWRIRRSGTPKAAVYTGVAVRLFGDQVSLVNDDPSGTREAIGRLEFKINPKPMLFESPVTPVFYFYLLAAPAGDQDLDMFFRLTSPWPLALVQKSLFTNTLWRAQSGKTTWTLAIDKYGRWSFGKSVRFSRGEEKSFDTGNRVSIIQPLDETPGKLLLWKANQGEHVASFSLTFSRSGFQLTGSLKNKNLPFHFIGRSETPRGALTPPALVPGGPCDVPLREIGKSPIRKAGI